VEVRQLRYFVAVAEELHFGRAAERLHVAQPAVSQQLGRLERELGVRLLERTSQRVVLTSDGKRLLDEARAALAAVDRVHTMAAELTAGRAAVLRVGTTPGVGPRLSRAAARWRAVVPDLTLVLVDGTVAEHIAALRAGELNIALVRGRAGTRGRRPATGPAGGGARSAAHAADRRPCLPGNARRCPRMTPTTVARW
jgi:DNA-binding transcriptional LysR family regulator